MRVFAWSDLMENKVPTMKSFVLFIDKLRAVLPLIDEMYGAFLLGSAVSRKYTCTSDIDLIVMPNADLKCNGMKVALRDLRAEAQFLHIPLNIDFQSKSGASSGYHTISRSFYLHLLASVEAGGVIKNNPCDDLCLNLKASLVADVREVLVRKAWYVNNWDFNLPLSAQETRDRFAKVLSMPSAVCLKMLYAHSPLYRQSAQGLFTDYRRVYLSKVAQDALDNLIMWKDRYLGAVRQFQIPKEDWLSYYPLTDLAEKTYDEFVVHALNMSLVFAKIFLEKNLWHLQHRCESE